MEAYLDAESPDESLDTDIADGAEAAVVEETSAEFVGRWNRLISTTNWEKGRIIFEWRRALIDSGAPAQECSDEAWSRRVGNVSPQHVGRLRRVHERFGQTAAQFPGLYWSHFQAALDWHDAEMWLEGGVHNGWSVAQMRHARWETIGSPPDQIPREQDVVLSEMDEDVDPAEDSMPATLTESLGVVQGVAPEDLDQGEREEVADSAGRPLADDDSSGQIAVEPFRPFENLAKLPDDLADAFEAFKLAIINHRLSGWRKISCVDVLAALDALKQLALAPPDA
jgi:hypothetical protein